MQFTVQLWADESVDVEITVSEDGGIVASLDGVWLDERIINWAFEYGFRQGIRDAAASEPEDDKRNAKAWKRIDALKTNTLREGGGGGPKLTPVQREVKAIAEREIATAFAKPENQKWVAEQRAKTGLGLTALREAAAKAHAKKHAARLEAEAKANLAAQPEVDLDLDIAV